MQLQEGMCSNNCGYHKKSNYCGPGCECQGCTNLSQVQDEHCDVSEDGNNSSDNLTYIEYDNSAARDWSYYWWVFIWFSKHNINAYINMSIAKENIGDTKGACVDAKKVVSLGEESSENKSLISENKSWIKKNC